LKSNYPIYPCKGSSLTKKNISNSFDFPCFFLRVEILPLWTKLTHPNCGTGTPSCFLFHHKNPKLCFCLSPIHNNYLSFNSTISLYLFFLRHILQFLSSRFVFGLILMNHHVKETSLYIHPILLPYGCCWQQHQTHGKTLFFL
jgi:hypothetical protein